MTAASRTIQTICSMAETVAGAADIDHRVV